MRVQCGVLFLFCVGMMVVALFLQYAMHLEPCPLCVIDRGLVVLAGLIYFIAWVHSPKNISRYRWYSALGLIVALVGIGVCGWHWHLLLLPPSALPSCTPSLNYLLETLPLSQVLLTIFKSSGECAKAVNLWGIPIPVWTLGGFLVIALGSIWVFVGAKKRAAIAATPSHSLH